MSKLFIVSNRLPLTIEKKGGHFTTRQSSGGLVSAINAYLKKSGPHNFSKNVWIGVPGCDSATWDKATSELVSNYDFEPVFVQQKLYDQYYNGFANSVLWPLFHYFPSFAEYQPAYYDAYCKVNRLFADELTKIIGPNDVVWIHDYHLLPLAGMLRDRFPLLTIGFFLHIPFPSYELFRVLPRRWQQELLQGMLGADVIGFHTADYMHHFGTAVQKITGARTDDRKIYWQGRMSTIGAFPIGIDYDRFQDAYSETKTLGKRAEYLRLKQDKKLIFSVDRLDYTKGIFNRLKGYREFLTQYPAYHGKVVFALVVVPSRDTICKYAERKKMIDEYIGNFNSRFGHIGWQPILYQYGHLSFDELVGLYTACDLALITPLRDGMNLVAKEFVASRQDRQGVLILSEMAGAADELTEALLINPNDQQEIARMIRTGLEMKPEEQEYRMAAMQQRISNDNVVHWATGFIESLQQASTERLRLKPQLLDNFVRSSLCKAYSVAQKRLILLDYDGTLVPFSAEPEKAIPDEKLLNILADLAADDLNTIYVISGRGSDFLEQHLGRLPIGLVAEHGAKIRQPGDKWNTCAFPETKAHLQRAEFLLQRYVYLCSGSFIERKDFSLAWHYRKADPDTSSLKAGQLYRELWSLMDTSTLDILNGNKVIEIKGIGINKGVAVNRLISGADHDFILCIGDDETDEDMFREISPDAKNFTVKVGEQPSAAAFQVITPYVVQELLQDLALIPETV